MTDRHPSDDELLDLVLGQTTKRTDEIAEHLMACRRCREEHDALSRTVDHSLAAAPRIAPPPGFDASVLDAFRAEHPARSTPRWSRRLALAAAACAAGIVLGVAGTLLVGPAPDGPAADSERSTPSTPLVTGDGTRVGSVAVSYLDERRIIVVAIGQGGGETRYGTGDEYECRLRLTDGDTVTLGQWSVPATGTMWVMPAPAGTAERLELVDDTGDVWSTADI